MRKFSIIRHYFITPGRYSCPGVSPARGGWPWNAGNAPVCGGAGEGRESEGRFRERWFRRWFREWWFQRWFREWFRELVVAGMVSRPVPGGGCRMVPEWFRADAGGVPGGGARGVFRGGGTGMAAGRRTGMCGRDGLGLPGAARGREYTDFSGGRCALIILFVADY